MQVWSWSWLASGGVATRAQRRTRRKVTKLKQYAPNAFMLSTVVCSMGTLSNWNWTSKETAYPSNPLISSETSNVSCLSVMLLFSKRKSGILSKRRWQLLIRFVASNECQMRSKVQFIIEEKKKRNPFARKISVRCAQSSIFHIITTITWT